MKRYVFGPVPSRRLGFSLGVDIVPRKYCTFDCVYCQVGKTTEKTAVCSSFFNSQDIVDEILVEVRRDQTIDFVTFSGSGEPTLNEDLGSIISSLRKHISTPIAVITNGSLLHRPDVRKELAKADVLMPSLDAVTEDTFLRINRPESSIAVEEMIDGLKALRADFRGQIWLEIMLIKNVNDSPQHVELLKQTLSGINVDKIQLNTITRPPCEGMARGVTEDRLSEIRGSLGSKTEIICEFQKQAVRTMEVDWEDNVLAILRRRSLTIEDVVAVTGGSREQVEPGLNKLLDGKRITRQLVGGIPFYVVE
jgi:wyosine [tRNA(Phe)-imidazoG37] synthetase (radical SAM superfamily)